MWEGPRAGSAPSEAWGEVGNADRTDPDRAAFLGAVHSVIAALSRAQTPRALIMWTPVSGSAGPGGSLDPCATFLPCVSYPSAVSPRGVRGESVTKRAFCPTCQRYVYGRVESEEPCPVCSVPLGPAEDVSFVEFPLA